MPLSFRRSYNKRPTGNLNLNEGGTVDDTARTLPDGAPTEFRRAPYPTVIPIGCALTIALGFFLMLPWANARTPWVPGVATLGVAASTRDQIEWAASPEVPALLTPTLFGPPTQAPSEAVTPTDLASSDNPWAAEIPETVCIPKDLPQTGRVVEVLDGDTIRVLMDRDGRVYSVHYLGVEAPRAGIASGVEGRLAMARNTELVLGKRAVLVRDISDSDSSGTLLRYVMVADVFVNQALILGGLAQAVMESPDTACGQIFLAAQQQAQSQARGIWSSRATPTPLQ